MFDIGGPEIILILLAIVILFGPKKLPEAARAIGKGIKKIKDAQLQFQEQLEEIRKEASLDDETNDFIKEVSARDVARGKVPGVENVSSEIARETEIRDSKDFGFEPIAPANEKRSAKNGDNELAG